MRILVLYATTEGQTRKIARHVMAVLSGIGHGVELMNVTESEGVDLSRYDRAVLAGSLHAGGYQAALAGFARAQAARLNAMPTLFLPVSLSAAGDTAVSVSGVGEGVFATVGSAGVDSVAASPPVPERVKVSWPDTGCPSSETTR